MGYTSRSNLLGYRKTKKFAKITSVYCHGVMPPEDVFPKGSSLKTLTAITGDMGI